MIADCMRWQNQSLRSRSRSRIIKPSQRCDEFLIHRSTRKKLKKNVPRPNKQLIAFTYEKSSFVGIRSLHFSVAAHAKYFDTLFSRKRWKERKRSHLHKIHYVKTKNKLHRFSIKQEFHTTMEVSTTGEFYNCF